MFNNTDRRTHESPMDWEWQTQGPVDPSSPFPQFRPQPGQKKSFESSAQTYHSFTEGPSTPAPQFRNPSFTTPRRPFDQDFYSEVSGAESSPADNGDGEDTPDFSKRSKPTLTFAMKPPEKTPIFGRYGAQYTGNSPGRAEIRRGKYANNIMAKMRRRKKIERDYSLIKNQVEDSGLDSDTDSLDSRSRAKRPRTRKSGSQHWLSSLLNDIHSRPDLPNILTFYAQLCLNIFFISAIMFTVWTFWRAIQADVDRASVEARELLATEVAACTRHYVNNKCGRDIRLPALEISCDDWERCMNQDINSVARARISAHTFAEIFNSFIEPISYKAMAFFLIFIMGGVIFNNFGMIRSKTLPSGPSPQFFTPQPPQNFEWETPPISSRISGSHIYGNAPYQSIMPNQASGQRSPSKSSRTPSRGSRI